MGYSAEVVQRARARLAQAKEDRESENRQHLAEAYAKVPRIREIDMLLRRTMAQAAQAAFLQGSDGQALLEQARRENLSLQQERAALAAAFLDEFWPLYRTGPRSGYLDEYRSRLALTGQRVLVTPRSGTPRPAAVLGIDDECRLVVRYDGESRPAALTSGEAGVRLL